MITLNKIDAGTIIVRSDSICNVLEKDGISYVLLTNGVVLNVKETEEEINLLRDDDC